MPYVSDKDFDIAIAQQAVGAETFQYQTRFNYWVQLFEAQFGDIVVFFNAIESETNAVKFTIINNLKFTFTPYPTQIILRKGITKVNELFDEFDWSVCQIATDGEKVFATHKCIDNLEFKTPMKLTNEKGALRTLKRGFNLSHKLGLEVDHDDTIKLCEKLAKTKQQFKPIKKLDFGDDDI